MWAFSGDKRANGLVFVHVTSRVLPEPSVIALPQQATNFYLLLIIIQILEISRNLVFQGTLSLEMETLLSLWQIQWKAENEFKSY